MEGGTFRANQDNCGGICKERLSDLLCFFARSTKYDIGLTMPLEFRNVTVRGKKS
jgi:hypothetical protein